MPGKESDRISGHLDYYQRHGISPVRYDTDDLDAHFDRRDSLYRSLGLPPAAFRGCRVLEVAPGSGQNSLYVACCRPKQYDLVEPNPSGISDIRVAFAALKRPHALPVLHPVRLEAFESPSPYDIVICENWLGSLPNELALLGKLASLVAPGGVLAMTITPPSGLFSNIMRHLLGARIVPAEDTFERKTELLVSVFAPHLATIGSMTRSARDWVLDCILNPHYFNIVIPLETVIDTVGRSLEVLATFPRFTLDWRWFKSLNGDARRFNELALAAYRDNTHNFIDYRKTWPARPAAENAELDADFAAIHHAALAWDVAAGTGDQKALSDLIETIGARLGAIAAGVATIDPETAAAIDELGRVWRHPRLDAGMVREMSAFKSLFGRETVYLSLTRPRAA